MFRLVLLSMLLIFSGLWDSSMNWVSVRYQQRVHPVVAEVHLVAFCREELFEELADEEVVWSLVEAQRTHVVQQHAELDRQAFAEHLGQVRDLAVEDLLVLLALVRRLDALPGQRAFEEVHQHVAQGLQVVSAAELDAEVRVDARVARGADQAAVLFVGDVRLGLRVAVLLREVEVQDVHLRRLLLDALLSEKSTMAKFSGLTSLWM